MHPNVNIYTRASDSAVNQLSVRQQRKLARHKDAFVCKNINGRALDQPAVVLDENPHGKTMLN